MEGAFICILFMCVPDSYSDCELVLQDWLYF